MRTSKSSSASVAEIPQSIAAATRQKLGMHRFLRMSSPQSACPGQRMSRGKRHGKCGKRLGIASSASCCSRRLSKPSRAAPAAIGATSPKANPRGDNDTIVSKTQQTPLDSSRNAKRPEASSITRPRRCAGASDVHERAIFFQQIVFHQLTRQPLCHRLERLTRQLRRRHLRHTRFRPARRRNRKPCQTPYDEGHSDLHSSTSSCVSVPDRRPSAINGGSRSSVQVRSAASKVT